MKRALGPSLLLALVACSKDLGTPFSVTATAELRNRVEHLCVEPSTGLSEVSADKGSRYVQSKGGGCMVVLYFDQVTTAITEVMVIADDPPTNIRARLESIVLPVVNDDTRRVIQEQILADVGADKDLRIERKGKGYIHYRHETKVMGDPPPRTYRTAILRLGWY